MYIGPHIPIDKNSELEVMARVVGDLEGPEQVPTLENKILIKPNEDTLKEDDFNLAYLHYWMLAEREMFTFTGDEWNKIGVGYTAFQTQNDKWTVPANSCLKNQILDIYFDDLETIQAGETPKYVIGAHFLPDNINYGVDPETSEIYLSYLYPATQTTLVSLEISADNIKFYRTVASGQILEAAIRVDEFEAMSSEGYIDYSIQSESRFNSSFYVSLQNCTQGILTPAAHQIFTEPYEVINGTFNISTTLTESMNYTCIFILQNSEGTEIDSKEVNFSTVEQVNITVDQGNNGTTPDSTPVEEELEPGAGCQSCNPVNIIWMMQHLCIASMLFTFAVYASLIGFIVITCKYCPCIYKYLFCWCCYATGTKRRKKNDQNQQQEDQERDNKKRTKKKRKHKKQEDRKSKYNIDSEDSKQ